MENNGYVRQLAERLTSTGDLVASLISLWRSCANLRAHPVSRDALAASLAGGRLRRLRDCLSTRPVLRDHTCSNFDDH